MSARRAEYPAGGERSPAQQTIEAELLDQPETIACRMFGTTGYLMRDRLIAFWQGDSIVLKPPPDRRAPCFNRESPASSSYDGVSPSANGLGCRSRRRSISGTS